VRLHRVVEPPDCFDRTVDGAVEKAVKERTDTERAPKAPSHGPLVPDRES
jgi:hypothetical protein